MLNWIKKLLSIDIQIENPVSKKTLTDIEIFDTVWIKDGDVIYKGWIFDKTKKRFIIVAGTNEYIFHYSRPFDRTEIEYNNKILYFNDPCA